MFLIILLVLVTICISGSAAFFSVYGLAQLFAAAVIPAIIMGSSLEAGKLVAASFLYQYWKKIGITLKTYLILAVVGLMCITSVGIFGFLSSAYQKDSVDLKNNQQHIEYLTDQKTRDQNRLDNIDGQIKNVPETHITKKIQLIKTLNDEKKNILDDLNKVNTEREQLLSTKLHTEVKVGPITFVAKALGKSVDDATLYLIFMIMAVFDPLAVALTIATNFAIKERMNNKQISAPVEAALPDIIENSTEPMENPLLSEINNKLDAVKLKLDSNNKKQDIINSIRDI